MTTIEKACLEFCIELLNQCYYSYEYKSVLVCTMAVLRQGDTSQQDPESYLLILSYVIKIAWFMIVQKALQIDPNPWQIIQTQAWKDQSTEWVLASANNQLGEIDEGYGSNDPLSTPGPLSSPPSSIYSNNLLPMVNICLSYWLFQEQVMQMMHQFMICGTYGPIEILLDQHIYRLKVHYNYTAPGYVTWMGED